MIFIVRFRATWTALVPFRNIGKLHCCTKLSFKILSFSKLFFSIYVAEFYHQPVVLKWGLKWLSVFHRRDEWFQNLYEEIRMAKCTGNETADRKAKCSFRPLISFVSLAASKIWLGRTFSKNFLRERSGVTQWGSVRNWVNVSQDPGRWKLLHF